MTEVKENKNEKYFNCSQELKLQILEKILTLTLMNVKQRL